MEYLEMVDYIKKASNYGFKKVFSSLHIPEYSLEEQIDFVSRLAEITYAQGMELVTDVRGSVLREIYSNEAKREAMEKIHIDAYRIDFELEEDILAIAKKMGAKQIYINTSTIDKDKLAKYSKLAKKYELALKSCHNFYPRPETALGEDFFHKQNSIFAEKNVTVAAFLPSKYKTRGPINEGLPTVESHRNMPFEKAAFQMFSWNDIDEILIGDMMASPDELSLLSTLNSETLTLRIDLYEECYRERLTGESHGIRYDSGAFQIRLEGFRGMASYAEAIIEEKNATFRKAGSITIDNQLYGRYQGEVQIVTRDLCDDPRVNVIGRVILEDLWKLKYKDDYKKIVFI